MVSFEGLGFWTAGTGDLFSLSRIYGFGPKVLVLGSEVWVYGFGLVSLGCRV